MKDLDDIAGMMADIGARARAAATRLAMASSGIKRDALLFAADAIDENRVRR